MSDFNDEGQNYNKCGGWTYRVISELWTCPHDREAGRRLLTICRVHWLGKPTTYPVPGDIALIDGYNEDWPAGHTIEELETDLERMRHALDQPALISAEWEKVLSKRRLNG